MKIEFGKAEMYLEKTKKDLEKNDPEDALFHIRRALESTLEQINASTGFKYKSLNSETYIYKMIDDIRECGLISINQATTMHRIRALSNSGVHGDMNEDAYGQFAAHDAFVMMQELVSDLKEVEWHEIPRGKARTEYRKKEVEDNIKITPFVPKI